MVIHQPIFSNAGRDDVADKIRCLEAVIIGTGPRLGL